VNKAELVSEIAERVGKPKTEVTEIVDAAFEVMVAALVKQEEIRVPGFGVFDVKETAARKARNPQTGEEVPVPAGHKARFRPGKGLKDALDAIKPTGKSKK
jgi:DNA-binding protein HU-beta